MKHLAGVAAIAIQYLDISKNEFGKLTVAHLPKSLQQLKVCGNHISILPSDLASLPKLEMISAGANRLTDVDSAFASRSLIHASFAYNRLSYLNPDITSVRADKTSKWIVLMQASIMCCLECIQQANLLALGIPCQLANLVFYRLF